MKIILGAIQLFLLINTISVAEIINIPADIDSIQGGINMAVDGDTVLVQPGIYVESINFYGKNIVVGSLMLTTSDTSYISKTIIRADTSVGPHDRRRVITFENGENSTTLLSGFTIELGFSYNTLFGCNGGGISIDKSNPTCTNLIIRNNWSCKGGGVYCDSSAARFSHIKVLSNFAGRPDFSCTGGGFHFENSNLHLENILIINNESSCGGGIFCFNSELILNNLTIKNNCGESGGGIFCENSDITMDGVTITGNIAAGSAHAAPGFGGGICFVNSNLNIINSIIYNDTATYGAGISNFYFSNPDSSYISLSRVNIINNFSENSGGGLYIRSNTKCAFDTFNRCNIYNNYANQSGKDLFSDCLNITSVIVDTFTVLEPDSFYAYPLEKFTFDINNVVMTNINIGYCETPTNFVLFQNYPNPFNPSTRIKFQIPNAQFTTLKVYDTLGKEVSTLVSKKLNSGTHNYTFDGKNLASGIYYYQLVAGDYREVRKMILIK